MGNERCYECSAILDRDYKNHCDDCKQWFCAKCGYNIEHKCNDKTHFKNKVNHDEYEIFNIGCEKCGNETYAGELFYEVESLKNEITELKSKIEKINSFFSCDNCNGYIYECKMNCKCKKCNNDKLKCECIKMYQVFSGLNI